ncbi:sigma-70 family RNA polymerase sigma factor [Plantibacter sp. VKM Ac-2885]|nr:sigma-70 family RNA polymerase sigma factor [Plantibacter sp. VKM Ac-2885]MBF4514166.1 sigma-70 family RNA polymerase sigma factor [Plantibacter sp. VKM Ac-2885]
MALARLGTQRRKLVGQIQRVCGGLDPEDLLSEAILRLAERLADGMLLPDHIEAYVVRSAKNLAADYFRSPRSREHCFDPSVTEHTMVFAHHDEPLHHDIETAQDRALVRRALSNLSQPQQRLLIETAVHDRRPRELVDELGIASAAISTAAHRARKALCAEILRLILLRGEPGCHPHAARIAARPHAPPLHAARHLRDCATCRSNLEFFHSLTVMMRR